MIPNCICLLFTTYRFQILVIKKKNMQIFSQQVCPILIDANFFAHKKKNISCNLQNVLELKLLLLYSARRHLNIFIRYFKYKFSFVVPFLIFFFRDRLHVLGRTEMRFFFQLNVRIIHINNQVITHINKLKNLLETLMKILQKSLFQIGLISGLT